MHRNCSPPAPFGDAPSQQNLVPHTSVAAQNHFPLQTRYLASTQAGLEAKQHHDPVSLRVTSAFSVLQEQFHLRRENRLGRLAFAPPASTGVDFRYLSRSRLRAME